VEILNHFVDNLPSVIAIILAMIAGWAIKEIFLKKNSLIEFEQKIKEEINKVEHKVQEELTNKQNQIDSLKTKAHEQHSTIAELKITLKHIAETLTEIKDHLFTRRRKD